MSSILIHPNTSQAREPVRENGVIILYSPGKVKIPGHGVEFVDTEVSIRIPIGYRPILETPRELTLLGLLVCNYVDINAGISDSFHVAIHNTRETVAVLPAHGIIAHMNVIDSQRLELECVPDINGRGVAYVNQRNNPLEMWIYRELINNKESFIGKYTAKFTADYISYCSCDAYLNAHEPTLALVHFIMKKLDAETLKEIHSLIDG